MTTSQSPTPEDPISEAAPAAAEIRPGEPAPEVTPDATGTTANTPPARSAATFTHMTPGTPLTEDQLARITSDLLDLTELIQGDGAGRALIAQYAYLWMLGHFLRQMREANGITWDESPEAHDAALDDFRNFMASGGSSRIRWARMRMAGEKPVCAPKMRQMILALPLAAWALDPEGTGRASGLRFWMAWARRAAGGNLSAAELVGATHSWDEIDAVKLGPLGAAALDRIADDEIRAGAMARWETVGAAHALLLVRRALTRLLAQAAALDEGRARAEATDVEAAAAIVRQRFGEGSSFERVLEKAPRILNLLENYAKKTRFPYAMVNWTPEDIGRG